MPPTIKLSVTCVISKGTIEVMRIEWGCLLCGASAAANNGNIRWVTGCVMALALLVAGAPEAGAQTSAFADRFNHQQNARNVEWRGAPRPERYAPEPRERSWRQPADEDGASRYHTVASGETLFRIAKRYDASVEALARANGISDPRSLRVGQRLAIPDSRAGRHRRERDPDRESARTPRRYEDGRRAPSQDPRRNAQPRRGGIPARPEQRPARRWEPDGRRGRSSDALRALAATMSEPAGRGRDSEVPAGYTFFAQLVGADLQVDRILRAWREEGRGPRVSAALDLDIIYGEGADADSERFYLPYIRTGPRLSRAGKRYALSEHMPPAGHPFVTQLQAALIELHNRSVDLLIERHLADEKSRLCESEDCSNVELARSLPKSKRLLLFKDARETVIHYYHRIIIEDMLPRLIGEERTQDIITNGRDLFFASGFRDGEKLSEPFVPHEFALAAYQFTVSQLRESYTMREGERARRFSLERLAANDAARERLGPRDLADWRYFVDILPEPPEGFNAARAIDPYVASARDGWHENRRTRGAAESILVAGARAELAPGQAVAEKILPDLRKRGVLYLWQQHPRAENDNEPWRSYVLPPDRATRETVGRKTPLWYYVLQEAQSMGAPTGIGPDTKAYATAAENDRYAAARDSASHGRQPRRGGHALGPVGGTIVGEVIVGLAEHYALKTGKGLGYRPPIGASAYGESNRLTLTRARAKGGELGERYLLRNLLIDAGVAAALR
jgi:LysM repeat protein